MIVRTQSPDSRRPANAVARPTLRRRTMCQFIALALFGGAAHAATPPAFSPAWFASKQANAATQAPQPGQGTGNAGGNVFTPGNVMLQQRVQQSIANLDAAAQAVAAQMAAQKGAQSAAQQLVSKVPNGLGDGGLKVDRNVGADPSLWQNANQPTQTVANGRTNVEIKQTAGKAIMTWESFNVGNQTTVHFDQTGGNQTGGGNQWIALNRINDPSGKPSQILGQIKAEGTVYLLNRNGMIFGGGAQVDTHSLIASSLDLFTNDITKSNAFFLKYGIGSKTDPDQVLGNGGSVGPFLTDNGDALIPGARRGAITIEKGASINASKDGFALVAASAVNQGGRIVADDGQVFVAAAQGLTMADSATGSHMDIRALGAAGPDGVVSNTGLIQARRGSIKLLGEDVRQDGVLVASTSLSHPGSIVFDKGSGSNTRPKVELGSGSVTTILPEKDGETTTSTQDADKAFVTSRVDVNLMATVNSGALIEVPAGNVTFARDTYVDSGAVIDVSGLANVTLPMSALLVMIPRIGLNELANSPLLRDSFLFSSKNVPIDSTRSGTRPDGLDWIGSPILNVAGYVNNVPRTVDQLMIRSGNIAFKQNAIVRTGAQLRLEGGFINYLPGYIATPRLQGANGLVYDIASADPDVQYTGFAGVYSQAHARWGVTETYVTSPILANTGRWDPGFIRGGDAGTLSFGQSGNVDRTYDLILDGDVSAHAYAGREQVRSRNLPLAGTLDIDVIDIAAFNNLTGISKNGAVNFVIQSERKPLETYKPDFSPDDPWPARGGDPSDPDNPLWWRGLSTAMIDNAGFRKVRLSTAGTVLVKDGANLHVVDGGEVDITATTVDVQGTVTAHGGAINLSARASGVNQKESVPSSIVIGSSGRLDASGLWVNDTGRGGDLLQSDRWIDGGSVSLTGLSSLGGGPDSSNPDITPDIFLSEGSVVDVSGGGYVGTDGRLSMQNGLPRGRGGDITLQTHVDGSGLNYSTTGQPTDLLGGRIDLKGTLVANGFAGGGTLTLHAPQIQVGGVAAPTPDVALLYLDPLMFSSLGFSHYNLVADTDLTVAPGVQVVVRPRSMVADWTALLGVASRDHLLGVQGTGDIAQVGDTDSYLRYTHRNATDGLSVQAGLFRNWVPPTGTADYRDVTGTVAIGDGARIEVDPGNTIAIDATSNVVVDGTLVARGGKVALHAVAINALKSGPVNRSVWLGGSSVLDVSGLSLRDPMAGGLPGNGAPDTLRRDGVVLGGGKVELYSDLDVVAERGSRISLSGASDTYDLPADTRRSGIDAPGYLASTVWSDAGSLDIQSATGLYFDGSIDAHGGAPQARGGQLAISARIAGSESTVNAKQLTFVQNEWRLPVGSDPYATKPLDKKDGGDLRFAVDRLEGAGIDDVYIGRPIDGADASRVQNAVVAFAGDVSLQTGRSIQMRTSGLSAIGAGDRLAVSGGNVSGAGNVHLQAPYVSILGATATNRPASTAGDGSFTVDANAIDIGGMVNLSGFRQASFDALGDIRFTVPTTDPSINSTGWLFSAGNLEFTASRLYPMTHYAFLIDAANPSAETTIAFHPSAQRDASVPLSAGGALAVVADHIDQEGTLWVPSGAIQLGTDDPVATRTAFGLTAAFPLTTARDVHLAPGSVTSVSLGGAVLPYGTTQDGKDWRYDNLNGVPQPVVTTPPEKSVSIAGDAVAIDKGAVVDLSGGGDLQAVEWIPGTGGSRDVLSQTFTDYSTSQKGVQKNQYADGRPVYAIMPGYNAPLSAHDAALELGMGAGPQVGQAVYLSGVPGLPDGVYTLLPARYATMQGAYRVVQNTSVKDPIVGASTTAPDGSRIVTGYFTDTLTGARDARNSSFIVQSADTWGQYSEYTTTKASTFFSAKAASNGQVTPRLGADAGRLVIAASSALNLGATLNASAGKGGRGSQVDIAGEAIQVLGGGETAADGYLHVSADELSALGAGSLLIGGKRESTTDGDRVDVLADNVLLSNDASHPLQGSEVILVANGNGGVTLAEGSVLRATANNDAASAPLLMGSQANGSTPAVSGDGALIRVSGLDASPIVRANITGLDGPAGSPGGNLVIGAGATIASTKSISMDATGSTSLASDASLSARAIDVTAGRIGLGGTDNGDQAQAGTFFVGPRILAQLAQSDATTLRARKSIDLTGDVALSVSNALTLSAPTIHSDGGQISLAAHSLTIQNDTGVSAPASTQGNGRLQANVDELHLGVGNASFAGLASFGANVASGVFASGVGTIDMGAANIDIATPGITAGTGTDSHLVTTGAMRLRSNGGKPVASSATGGKLGFQAGSVDLGTAIVAKGGNVSLRATQGDLRLGDGASIDVSGVALPFKDKTIPVSGGTVNLQTDVGNVSTTTGSSIDIGGAQGSGSAGRLLVVAKQGSAALGGALHGQAAAGYMGGVLSVDTAGGIDLGALAAMADAGGVNGSVSVHTRNGDLTLGAGQVLRAHLITLTADGGDVAIGGDVDASGTFGGTIRLFGARGVDIDGGLNTSASNAGEQGGDITLGTSGVANGRLNDTYGYEEVDRADAGHVRIGGSARILQDGAAGKGQLTLRAPVLSDGDVPVTIASGLDLSHSASTSLEAYATWDSRDASTDPSKHFDGLVDPAGLFKADPVTGRPVLVSGAFVDDAGVAIAGPDPTDMTKVFEYLAKYRFTPDAPNQDHATFYGYVQGDESKGPGTLMGFIENPGFTFESRLKGAVPNLAVRPGVDLRNGDASRNGGDITVLSNWNLGAGTRDDDGTLHLAYRYAGQAPAISLRAQNNLVVRASITDGFFQQGNAGGSGDKPPEATQEKAGTYWEAIQADSGYSLAPDQFAAPAALPDGDSLAVREYYGQYVEYAKYLTSVVPELSTSSNKVTAATVIGFSLGLFLTQPVDGAPAPPPSVTNLNAYPAYLQAYKQYLVAAGGASDYVNSGTMPDTLTTLDAPKTTLDLIDVAPAPLDNSPSPRANANNPLPILSATLMGGQSSSYRLVAGADLASSDPSSVAQGATGSVLLGGHTDFTDPATNRVIAAPTVVRTGTGDIDIVAAGDIRWTDDRAPAAVYTAGAPAAGTAADGSVSILRPSQNSDLTRTATSELVVTGPVNPEGAGNLSLRAGGDIEGQQDTIDKTGDLTGTSGTLTAQYWWQWMQTGNSPTRSSINFGAFDQGLMSVGGNVSVKAGGNIRQLSVSLPTTWQIVNDANGVSSLLTYGGGNLDVHAGGDILSGSYFVARGQGTIQAGGQIGSDFSVPYTTPSQQAATMPVSTLIAMQDSQLSVQAGGSVSLGGIFNPSWLDASGVSALAPAGHADGQGYSARSRIDVTALGGDLTYGDLASPISLFAPGVATGKRSLDTAGDILPATVSLIAARGDLSLLTSGELFPSDQGNLSLLAQDNVRFNITGRGLASRYAWGIIDASLSSLASPLNLSPLNGDVNSIAGSVRQLGYLGKNGFSLDPATQAFFHAANPWHAGDTDPVRIYALQGDILNGSGGGVASAILMPNKVTRIEAGRDIVDLSFLGQQIHDADITVIRAGRDIVDTPLAVSTPVGQLANMLPVIAEAGPGYLMLDAGRNLGRLVSQSERVASSGSATFLTLVAPAGGGVYTGIDTVGNTYNPYLTSQGASILASFGTAPGMDRAAFIARYVDPAAAPTPGLGDGSASLVSFVENYDAGLTVDTGLAADRHLLSYTVAQAWTRFQALPEEARSIFVQQTLFRILALVGKDYNDASSPFAGQYARGYEALNTLFPASLGYTANSLGGGGNGAEQRVRTGDLDIRGTTIQTQRGGDVSILGPGGDAVLGSSSAPPVLFDLAGNVVAGPNTQGILTLKQGNVSMFTDGSTLLAQSRIFTEQGGDVTIWSSNGDVNAGKGAKTSSEIPPVRYLCTIDSWCLQDAAGQVAGAGIATLQTIPGAPEGSVYLMAPRGTVDAGDAGIRVSGNLVVAAAHVANADNVQVKGESVGLPVVQSVNVGALNSASAAASAATKAAEDVVRQQQSDARDRMPSIISVQVVGSDPSASIGNGAHATGYDTGSAVQVVRRAGSVGDGLTAAERARLQ